MVHKFAVRWSEVSRVGEEVFCVFPPHFPELAWAKRAWRVLQAESSVYGSRTLEERNDSLMRFLALCGIFLDYCLIQYGIKRAYPMEAWAFDLGLRVEYHGIEDYEWFPDPSQALIEPEAGVAPVIWAINRRRAALVEELQTYGIRESALWDDLLRVCWRASRPVRAIVPLFADHEAALCQRLDSRLGEWVKTGCPPVLDPHA